MLPTITRGCAQHVDHPVRVEPAQIERHTTTSSKEVTRRPGFVFDDVVDAGKILERPFDVRPQRHAELLFAPTEHLSTSASIAWVIEPTRAQIDALRGKDLELTGGFGLATSMPSPAITPVAARRDVECRLNPQDLVVLREVLLDERQQQVSILPSWKKAQACTLVLRVRAGRCH